MRHAGILLFYSLVFRGVSYRRSALDSAYLPARGEHILKGRGATNAGPVRLPCAHDLLRKPWTHPSL